MRHYSSHLLAALLIGTGFVIGCASTSSAHDSIDNQTNVSTWDRGSLNAFGNTAQVWVRKYYSPANICLNFDIIDVSTPVDLKMVVVSPDPGIVYRDDDSGMTCTNCPRIEIEPTGLAGYYTVVVTSSSGAPTNTNFILNYARWDAGTNRCPNATTPLDQRVRGKIVGPDQPAAD